MCGRRALRSTPAPLRFRVFGGFVAASRYLSHDAIWRLRLLGNRWCVALEEGELTSVNPHEKRGNLSSTRTSVNTRVDSVAVTGAQITRDARLKADLTQTELAE